MSFNIQGVVFYGKIESRIVAAKEVYFITNPSLREFLNQIEESLSVEIRWSRFVQQKMKKYIKYIPLEVLSGGWVAGAGRVRVDHHLKKKKILRARKWSDDLEVGFFSYKCVEGPQVASTDNHARGTDDGGWLELAAVGDFAVAVENSYGDGSCERVKDITHHTSHNNRIPVARHLAKPFLLGE